MCAKQTPVFERDQYGVRFLEQPEQERSQGLGGVQMTNLHNQNVHNMPTIDPKRRFADWLKTMTSSGDAKPGV